MFSKHVVAFSALSILFVSEQVLGRERWLERDNKAILLHPRRFGQENPAVISALSSACEGQVCGVLAGSAISTLLAASGECTQQDMADQIIDAAAQFDDATKTKMINLAIEFRQVEKNTSPDFTTNPPTNRNSVFCQTAPRNAQLNGLVQAQDPANDPNIFFDPATKSSVTKGSQANTFPFGTNGSTTSSNSTSSAVGSVSSAVKTATASVSDNTLVAVTDSSDSVSCTQSVVTVTVASTDAAAPTGSCSLVTLTVAASEATSTSEATATSVSAVATTALAAASSTAAASEIGNFGSCSVPQIKFGVGFDNRKETSFEPVDQTSYNHGSAQNIDVITQFICDALTNTCGADQTAKDTCATASTAADTVTAKTGGQADAFNAVFGITTNFANVAVVDDTGKTIAAGADSAAASTVAGLSSTAAASVDASATTATAAAATDASLTVGATSTADAAANTAASSGIGNFGSCSVPQIEFGTGFDNRKETSFQPVDQTSYNHGSAQGIDIITQFICDTLTNSCGADQTAKNTCATASAAADAVTAKTGGQADAFNAAFGITTDFAAIPSVDDQGNVIAGTGSGSASSGSTLTSSAAVATTVVAATSSTSIAAAATSTPAATSLSSTGGNLQTFTGALGGVTAPAVTDIGNGQFQVDGNSAFNSLQNALQRSCDVQNNQCSNAANASGNQGGLTVAACGNQETQCSN